MKIEIDVPILKDFIQTSADLTEKSAIRFLVHQNPSMLLCLRVAPDLAIYAEHNLDNLTGKVVTGYLTNSENVIDGDVLGYCQPENEGIRHGIVVLAWFPPDGPEGAADVKLSELLERSPMRIGGLRRKYMTGTSLSFTLPPELMEALTHIMDRDGSDLSIVVTKLLLDFARENL